MSQPPAYNRQYDFTGFSAANPSDQQPGTQIDAEFNAVKTTIDAIRSNLALIQRDDGDLANGTVGVDQLAADVVAFVSASSSWVLRGSWATLTVYAVGDVVSQDGGTYLAAVAHVSGTFATDLAAGKWFTIYSSTGATPSDGSVTTAKLADGSVTAPKLGFSSLDLAGSIRGATGLAAGSAVAATHLVYAKASSGHARAVMERATKAQGDVGYRWNGGTGSVQYEAVIDAGADTLSWRIVGGAAFATFFSDGRVDWSQLQRVTGASLAPASGSGIEYFYDGSAGVVQVFDRSAVSYLPLEIIGSSVKIKNGTIVGMTMSLVGGSPVADFTGLSINGTPAGYRGIPNNVQNGNYTLVAADAGKCIYGKNTGAQAITVPTNASVAFSTDTAITIINNGTTALTIVPAGGVSLIWAGVGSTGTRTLATKGMASIKKVESDIWFVSGAGLS